MDAAGALGKIFLTVGETNGAVVAVHFHEAAQIHRLPHIVLGLTLDLDAETGVIAVLFLGGVEDHHDVLLQLIEAVVHQPDELAANKAIALEGQTAVPLTILGVLLDSPQAHQGDKLSGGIEHQRLEVLEVLRLQVIQNLVIAAGLDVRHTVARFDTVNAKVAVDVQRAGCGQGQRGLADAGVASNEHPNLLCAVLNVVWIANHNVYSFSVCGFTCGT